MQYRNTQDRDTKLSPAHIVFWSTDSRFYSHTSGQVSPTYHLARNPRKSGKKTPYQSPTQTSKEVRRHEMSTTTNSWRQSPHTKLGRKISTQREQNQYRYRSSAVQQFGSSPIRDQSRWIWSSHHTESLSWSFVLLNRPRSYLQMFNLRAMIFL